MKQVIVTLSIMVLLVPLCVVAGDIEDHVSYYNNDNGSLYLQPMADAFGAALNSGLYHDGKVEKFGFHFNLGLHMMGVVISDEQTTFNTVEDVPHGVPAGDILPTIFGSTDGISVDWIDGYKPQGLYDKSVLPIPVPQLTIGSFAGTEVNFRFFQMNVNEDIGDIKIVGYGLRHSLSQYLFLFPVDVAVSYFRQNFKIGNIVEANATHIGLQASKQFSLLTLFAGYGYEMSSLDIEYTYEENNIAFELDGKNKSRLTLGGCLDFKFFKLYADYNIASQKVFSLGLGLGI